MNKRIGFILTVLVFLVVTIGLYVYLKTQQQPTTNAIYAIPTDVAAIVELKNPFQSVKKITSKNELIKKLAQLPSTSRGIENMKLLGSIFTEDNTLQSVFNNESLLISFHDIGNKEIKALFLAKISQKSKINQIYKKLESTVFEKATVTSSKYNQSRIYRLETEKGVLFYTSSRGVLMASESEIVIKNSIRQVESENGLQTNSDFIQLMKTSGNSTDANLFLHLDNAKGVLGKIISNKTLTKYSIANFGKWMGLDISLKSNALLLNGFSRGVATKDFQYVLKGQNTVNMKFYKYVPVDINGFIAFGISDYNLFKDNLGKYMLANNQAEIYDANKKKIVDVYGGNAEKDLANIFKNEMAQVSLKDGKTLFYIRTAGNRNAKELVLSWLTTVSAYKNKDISDFIREYKIDNDSKFAIYKMPLDFLPSRLFGPWFKESSAEYVTVFDDYLIFSSDYNTLTQTIFNNVLEKSLHYDGAFNSYSEYLTSKVNFHSYLSLRHSNTSMNNIASSQFIETYKKHENILSDFYGISWQLSNDGELMYNNILLKHNPNKNSHASTEWETRLDTLVAFKPQFVKNHNTNEKEIFVQDMRNNIYLISNTGRVIWKKKISEPILGQAHQVDYYKNGKLQLLFNTKSKIYIIDRNGNPVERYPIKLNTPTKLPLSLFDYDHKKDYRIFVCGLNREVIVYGIDGKTIPGFKFNKADNDIISPVQHIKDKDKDFIIVTDSTRTYILDRRGEERVKLSKQFSPSPNNEYIYQEGNDTRKGRVLRTDCSGKVYYVYFDGTIETKVLEKKFSKEHYFDVVDVTGDNVYEFIYVDKKELKVFSLSGEKLFSYEFDNKINYSCATYKFSATSIYIGVTDQASRQIFLFDGEGKIADGFPLFGKTEFSIGFLKKGQSNFNLVVGGDNQYLFNYKLN